MCRHERFARTPSLETALAYEVIFKRSVSELFGGLYQKAEREVAERAKILAQRNIGNESKDNQRTARKSDTLTQLSASSIS